MSDLNWNKSSFSADSANCVEVAWCTSSFCHQGSCVEVGWTASSRCAGGDCVEVTRTSGLTEMVLVARSQQGQVQAPIQSWTVDEWRDLLRQIKWGWEQPEGVFLLADGRVEFGLDRHEKLTYDAGEWEAFIKDVPNDRFEPENLADYGTWARESSKLSEGVSAGSGSVAGSGEAATGTDVSWRGGVTVAADQQFGATSVSRRGTTARCTTVPSGWMSSPTRYPSPGSGSSPRSPDLRSRTLWTLTATSGRTVIQRLARWTGGSPKRACGSPGRSSSSSTAR
jgi:hypothetical protein